MKAIRKHLELITLFFLFTFLLQSCKAYRIETATVDEALLFSKNIKVVSDTNKIYKFKSLQKKEGEIYGIAKKKSKTAKKLTNQIVKNNNSDLVKIHLLEENIKKIYLQNKSMSVVGNILIVIGSLFSAVILAFAMGGGVGMGSGSFYY